MSPSNFLKEKTVFLGLLEGSGFIGSGSFPTYWFVYLVILEYDEYKNDKVFLDGVLYLNVCPLIFVQITVGSL